MARIFAAPDFRRAYDAAMEMTNLELPDFPKLASGKVREIFDLGEYLLIVATDRISAFDCILPNPIPRKGQVLNLLSEFWFARFDFVESHLVATNPLFYPPGLQSHGVQLQGRSMIVKKARPLPVECVVRGYLAGSGWKEYQASKSICGISLPAGLREAEELPEVLFTPTTKAESGHDESISWDECRRLLGESIAEQVRTMSLRIYQEGRAYAAERGIIVADTKFEFGVIEDRLVLIDECLTPDSSRFWPAEQHQTGATPPSFDKQFLRDYLETLTWDKSPPAPVLPDEIIQQTSERYIEAYERLTGKPLPKF